MIFPRLNDARMFGYFRPGIAVLCHLGNKSSSTSTDDDVASTDDAQGVGGGSASKDSGSAASAAGWFSTAQSVQADGVLVSGSSNKFGDDFTNAKIQDGGVSLGGANTGTITVTNSAEGVEKVTETFAATVKDLVAARASGDGVKLGADAKDKTATTETDSTESKTKVLAWVGGVVAFLVVGEILRRLFFSKAKKS